MGPFKEALIFCSHDAVSDSLKPRLQGGVELQLELGGISLSSELKAEMKCII